jgi:hypothetical protein
MFNMWQRLYFSVVIRNQLCSLCCRVICLSFFFSLTFEYAMILVEIEIPRAISIFKDVEAL